MCMVTFVLNNLAVIPTSTRGVCLSRTAILEGHERKYDLAILRAFGTKCYWMLTLEKKGGAMFPKARLGVIVGIEDNMPAYRVYDFEKRGTIRRIPFSQVVTHEGHFPFKDRSKWTEEDKALPTSFIPSVDARNDSTEWSRYGFSDAEVVELDIPLAAEPFGDLVEHQVDHEVKHVDHEVKHVDHEVKEVDHEAIDVDHAFDEEKMPALTPMVSLQPEQVASKKEVKIADPLSRNRKTYGENFCN